MKILKNYFSEKKKKKQDEEKRVKRLETLIQILTKRHPDSPMCQELVGELKRRVG